jgi:RNA polymerase sigma factor (sigma-70 family)
MWTARTTTALLDLLREPRNAEVWQELDSRYRPIAVGFARRLGLTREDAEDAAQETLLRFSRAYTEGRYDRTRGRLRSWMLGIARRCILDILALRSGRREKRGESALGDLPAVDEMERLWEEEHRRVIRERALHQLRGGTRFDDRTIRAFELLVMEEKPAAEVADLVHLSLDSVYAAKHRCARQLRRIVEELSRVYEMD